MIAFEMTRPLAPLIPCNKRKKTNVHIPVESIHPRVATTKIAKDQISGRFRPYLSEMGPINNCPTANPNIPAVRLN